MKNSTYNKPAPRRFVEEIEEQPGPPTQEEAPIRKRLSILLNRAREINNLLGSVNNALVGPPMDASAEKEEKEPGCVLSQISMLERDTLYTLNLLHDVLNTLGNM